MIHDEEVTRAVNEDGSSTYSHPSFGMISVHRTSGGTGGMFGTETECRNSMRVTISHAEVRQDLGKNWYFDRKDITEVEMSPVQYAEMISSPNTSGTPCTITKTEKLGAIRYRGIDTVTEYAEKQLHKSLDKAKKDSNKAVSEISKILSQKTIKKADKDAIIKIAEMLVQDISSNLPFYEKSVKESIERTKMEAKTEVESYVAHAITRAGITSINQGGDILRLNYKQNKDGDE